MELMVLLRVTTTLILKQASSQNQKVVMNTHNHMPVSSNPYQMTW